MLMGEPLLWSSQYDKLDYKLYDRQEAEELWYTVAAFFAMALHFTLIADTVVFSVPVLSYLLVCGHVMEEIGRFLVALIFLLLTFSTGVSILKHSVVDFRHFEDSFLALLSMTFHLSIVDPREVQEEAALLLAIYVFYILAAILLLSLLIAQMNCSYSVIYEDMKGYAFLKRAWINVHNIDLIAKAQWDKFVAGAGFDIPIEFFEGDVGPPGGISKPEPAGLHNVLEDLVARFGGDTMPSAPWPTDQLDSADLSMDERFEKLEAYTNKTLTRVLKFCAKCVARNDGSSAGGSQAVTSSEGSSDGGN
jgi:hypothetical protein